MSATPHQTPLSEAIRAIRIRLEISQNQLSRMLIVTPNTVSRWERGEIVPSTWHLINLRRHARTEAEIRPILLALESKGVEFSSELAEADGQLHKTSIEPTQAAPQYLIQNQAQTSG